MKRRLLALMLLVIGLIGVALIFSLAQRDIQIKRNNQLIITQIFSSSKEKPTSDIIFLKRNWQDDLLELIPGWKNDVIIKQTFLDIQNRKNYIQKGLMFRDMFQDKDNCLTPLVSIKKDLHILKQLGISSEDNIQNTINNWLLFLGEENPRNYLVLIQDPTIPRPSGGLLGDYCILSLDKGKIHWRAGSVLDLDDLFIKKVIPPAPLQFISNKWFFHDLNWFFDFPTTGRTLQQAYNNLDSNHPVQGTILLNPSIIESILSVVGPISISKYNLVINQDNFGSFFRNEIRQSVRFNNINKPIYSRDMPTLFFQGLLKKMSVLPPSSLASLINGGKDNFLNKNIQIFCQNDNLEYYFNTLGGAGAIKAAQNDYLAVVINSLQRVFILDKRKKHIILNSHFTSSGVINKLIVKADADSTDSKQQENYLQIYLPSGISIINAQGNYLKTLSSHWPYQQLGFTRNSNVQLINKTKTIDTSNRLELLAEGNKTVVTTWAKLSQHPFILEYKIPLSEIPVSWNLILQKQSGQNMDFTYNVVPPSGSKIRPTLFPLGKAVPMDNDFNISLDFIR